MNDLFETPELIPSFVKEILDSIPGNAQYGDLAEAVEKLNKVGYEFDYDLGATPFNLRKIS